MAVTDTLAEITSEAELRELLEAPIPRVITKERTRLHQRDVEWLAAETLEELERYYGPQYAARLYG
jgi:hypothetical protein